MEWNEAKDWLKKGIALLSFVLAGMEAAEALDSDEGKDTTLLEG